MLQEYKVRVLSHFSLAKYFLPLLKPSQFSSFTFVTGAAGVSEVWQSMAMGLFVCRSLVALLLLKRVRRAGPQLLQIRFDYVLIYREYYLVYSWWTCPLQVA